MDLKVKDVAELLNVSESTIRRWIAERKIPSYRINQSHFFSRSEIEGWVLSRGLSKTEEESLFEKTTELALPSKNLKTGGIKQFSLFRAVHKGEVLSHVPGKTKEEVISSTMKLVAKKLHLDADVMIDLLLDRERMMPTALNNGIGIPHPRDFLLSGHQDIVIAVFPQHELDYGALDRNPVHTLFFLFACEDKRHLHLLAKIAHLTSQIPALEFLKTKPSKQELLAYLKEWESQVPTL